jgi:hypothetical protein
MPGNGVIVVFWYANYSDLRDVKVIRRHKADKARQKEVGKVKACKTTEYYKMYLQPSLARQGCAPFSWRSMPYFGRSSHIPVLTALILHPSYPDTGYILPLHLHVHEEGSIMICPPTSSSEGTLIPTCPSPRGRGQATAP